METILEARKLIDIPDELFTAIGKVSVRHGQIEHVFMMTFHRVEKISYDEAITRFEDLRRREDDIKPIGSTSPVGARGIFDPLVLETSSTAASIPSSPKAIYQSYPYQYRYQSEPDSYRNHELQW